ncbi:MAG: NADH-quinone oxidoreductase subunit A [Parvularculaceae bacterium]|uniref:NADH-quinone oxidoreductase subunit A n=1 Tax=Methylocystis sp. TaxID=1911079 RepID=UPI003D10B821
MATADFLLDYLPIIVFLVLAIGLGAGFLIAPAIVAPADPDPEKLSTYECGFNAFDDARMKFDVQFYIVAILFIIVDLDVAFLFPWAVALFNPTLGATRDFQIFAFWSMVVFLAVFAIGFLYEWKKGALEWR